MLLWSSGLALVGALYYSQRISPLKLTELTSLDALLLCLLGGAFFGFFVAPVLCFHKRAAPPNIGAVIGLFIAIIYLLFFAAKLSPTMTAVELASGLIWAGIALLVGGIAGHICRASSSAK